jgi:hypothetical protein
VIQTFKRQLAFGIFRMKKDESILNLGLRGVSPDLPKVIFALDCIAFKGLRERFWISAY